MVHNNRLINYVDSPASSWSRHQDKLFERALVTFPDETPQRWEKIATQVPGKNSAEVIHRYQDLVRDLSEIESGLVELPSYEDDFGWGSESGTSHMCFGAGKGKEKETERRKGVPWTAEEHRLFLIGLEKYGKGDWRSISRNAVVSRTPTQVASHAQKYFLRLNSVKKQKKRSSIHDITTAGPGQSGDQNWVGSLMGHEQLGSPNGFDDQGTSLGYQGFGFQMS